MIYSDNAVLVIEVKFYSRFGETQIPKYRQELDGGQSFPGYAGKFLVSLTRGEVPKELQKDLDANIFWPEVLKLLAAMTKEKDLRPSDGYSRGTNFMLEQFAEFLTSNYVTPMEINKMNPSDLKTWADCLNLQTTTVQLLERFRIEQKGVWKAMYDWLVAAAKEFSKLREELT